MKKSTEYDTWLQGVLYASNIVHKEGAEGLAKEIKRRNITRMTSHFTQQQLNMIYTELSDNIYTNILSCMLFSLHDAFGWGGQRLKRLRDEYDKNVKAVMDLDYMGEHYLRLEDYAVELNSKYDLGIDTERIASCQDHSDEGDKRYHMVKAERLLEQLRSAGFNECAEYIEKKIL